MHYKYYRKKKHSRSGLAWNRPRADRVLSWPTSVFHAIDVCKILSRSVEIWLYEGQNLFWSKNRTAKHSLGRQSCVYLCSCKLSPLLHISLFILFYLFESGSKAHKTHKNSRHTIKNKTDPCILKWSVIFQETLYTHTVYEKQ